MGKKLREWFMNEAFTVYKDEINKENRIGIHLLAVMGIPLSIANFAAQFITNENNTSIVDVSWIVICFFFALILDRYLIPEDTPYAKVVLYAIESPVMLIAVLLGSVWDPGHQAITILLFVLIMPIFIMDYPWRWMTFMGGWAILFIFFSYISKNPYIFRVDLIHIIEFLVASFSVGNTVLLIRLRFLKNLDLAEYRLNNDRQTSCLSRYALAKNTKKYVNRSLMVLLADVDRLRLYRDLYGHVVADDIVGFMARTMKETFGADCTYRYGGDEILCVMELDKTSMEESFRRLEQCRDKLNSYSHKGKAIPVTFALGYATGTPADEEEFRGMIQLADIFTHRARKTGLNQTSGGNFDRRSLREGIVDSTLYGSAEVHETDSLTGLPNMSFFIARADEMLKSVVDPTRSSVVGHFKILHLRSYNNRYGYERGDKLIKDTARILERAFDKRMVSHISAGQFCMLCYEDEVEKCIGIVADQFRNYDEDREITFKVGLSRYTGRETAIAMLDKAKLALKSIEKKGDMVIRFYDEGLESEISFAQYIVSHVDEAIANGWLQVYYQPIARAVTGEVCDEEALSRWVDPVHGFLPPYRFIPPLEARGLMYKVNLHVVKTVLRDFKKRREDGIPVVPVSVNLSRKDFEQCDMAEKITGLVDDAGFDHSMIKIEITESAFISNQEMLRHEVARFHANGFEVWMDDFGSEYSTLNLLQEMDFDLIKIDMKFMKNFAPGSKNYIIVSHIIQMARDMGITTLIEGVETWEQYRIVKKLGCEKIQGYLFNKPNPYSYIKERVASGNGLVFESASAVPYYEAIGGIDLNKPRALNFGDRGLRMTNEIPEGILELRGGRLYLLRGNESFLQQMEAWGYIHVADQETMIRAVIDPVPEDFLAAASTGSGTDDWVSFVTMPAGSASYAVYMKRITDRPYDGGMAMLTVLMPARAT